MKEEGQITSVNSSEKTESVASDRTVQTPHFDAAAIENARPAVPLSQVKRSYSWPTGALLALAILAGLAGGLIGGSLTGFYLKDGTPQGADSGQEVVATGDQGATAAPTPAQAAPQQQQTAPEMGPREAGTKTAEEPGTASLEQTASVPRTVAAPQETEMVLRGALSEWVAATNARDIDRQMSFYNPVVEAFYRLRNASREEVRADKARVFARATSIDVRADSPEIRLSPDGRTAIMRFHKRYAIAGGGEDRRGEVLQELRWQQTGGEWRIMSERDLRVIH